MDGGEWGGGAPLARRVTRAVAHPASLPTRRSRLWRIGTRGAKVGAGVIEERTGKAGHHHRQWRGGYERLMMRCHLRLERGQGTDLMGLGRALTNPVRNSWTVSWWLM